MEAKDWYIAKGVSPNNMSGDNVHVSYSATASTVAAAQMVITDANGQIRTIKSYERLVLNDLSGDVSAGHVEVCNSSTLSSSTLIGSFGQNGNPWMTDGEGYSMPIGLIPWVINNGTSSTAAINISGSGRLMEGQTAGVRPPWRESQTRGD